MPLRILYRCCVVPLKAALQRDGQLDTSQHRVDSWTNLEVRKPLLTMAAELDVSQVIGDPRIPIHNGKRVQKQWEKQMEIRRGGKKNHDSSSERPLGKQVMLAKQRRKGTREEREFSKLRLKEMSAEPAAPAVLKTLSCSGCVHPQAPVNSSRCSDLWG